jgi:heterodisulfide reductase subunit C2
MNDTSFLREVEERSGQDLNACYQCSKCSAGCPLSSHMEYKPNSVIRLIQYGLREQVLKSHAVWLCVSCMNCGVRCPNEVDMSSVMDTLREMSIEAGYALEAEKRVVMLHQEFVRSVKLWGRLHEATFFMAYMARSLDILGNIPSAIALLRKRKIRILPRRIRGVAELANVCRAYSTGARPKEEE